MSSVVLKLAVSWRKIFRDVPQGSIELIINQQQSMESTLIKSEDDMKLGATTNYLDDRVKIQKRY